MRNQSACNREQNPKKKKPSNEQRNKETNMLWWKKKMLLYRPGGEAIEMRPELFLESGEIGLFDGGLLEAEKDFLVPLQLVALVP